MLQEILLTLFVLKESHSFQDISENLQKVQKLYIQHFSSRGRSATKQQTCNSDLAPQNSYRIFEKNFRNVVTKMAILNTFLLGYNYYHRRGCRGYGSVRIYFGGDVANLQMVAIVASGDCLLFLSCFIYYAYVPTKVIIYNPITK